MKADNHVETPANNNTSADKANNRSLAALTESLSAASTPDTPLDLTQLSKEKLAVADSRSLEAKLATFALPQDSAATPTQEKETPKSTPAPTPTPTPTPTPAPAAAKKDAKADNMGDMTDAEMAEMQKMMSKMKVKGGLSGIMKGMMGGGKGGKKMDASSLFDFGGEDKASSPAPAPAPATPPVHADSDVKLAPELAGLTLDDDAANGPGFSQEPGAPRPWRCKYTLRSHFDGVRVVAFHPTENALFSASEDYTLKMWNLNSLAPQPKKGLAPPELEPIYTFRGHTGPVYPISLLRVLLNTLILYSYAMSIHSEKGRIFSAGGDSVIRIWAIPPMTLDTYDPHGVGVDYRTKTIEGHTDAISS